METANGTSIENQDGIVRVGIKSRHNFFHLMLQHLGWILVLLFLIPGILEAASATERRATLKRAIHLIKDLRDSMNLEVTTESYHEEKPRRGARHFRINSSEKLQWTELWDLITLAYITEVENEMLIREQKALIEKLKREVTLCSTDLSGNSQLHLAVRRKDERVMNESVQLGANVNARNVNSETPLILASKIRNNSVVSLKIVKYLIHHGADLFATDEGGQTFLHKLVSKGTTLTPSEFKEITEYLVAENASRLFNIRDRNQGVTPLMLAAKNFEVDESALDLLRRNHVDFTLADEDGKYFLSYLVQGNKNLKLLSDLMHHGVLKYATLGDAIDAINESAVKKLVAFGANVNGFSERTFETPLHRAAVSSNKAFAIKILKFFVESGADITSKDKEEYTFLHRLVDDGTTLTPNQLDDIANFLVASNKAQLFNSPGFRGSTPFQLAVKNVEVENATLFLLKNKGVNFNALDDDEDSPLFYAVAGSRNLAFLRNLIITFGANSEHLNINNETLLHYSTLYGNCRSTDQLQFFLDLGLDINAVDIHGRTPLQTVLWNRMCPNVFDNIRFLVKSGANVNTRDILGDSPLDDVSKEKCPINDKAKVAELLRKSQQRVKKSLP